MEKSLFLKELGRLVLVYIWLYQGLYVAPYAHKSLGLATANSPTVSRFRTNYDVCDMLGVHWTWRNSRWIKANIITNSARNPHVNIVTKTNNLPTGNSRNEAGILSWLCVVVVMSLWWIVPRGHLWWASYVTRCTSQHRHLWLRHTARAKGHSLTPNLIFCSTCCVLLVSVTGASAV